MKGHWKRLPIIWSGLGISTQLLEQIRSLPGRNVLLITESRLKVSRFLFKFKENLSKDKTEVKVHFVRQVKKELELGQAIEWVPFIVHYRVIIGIGNSDLLNYTKQLTNLIRKQNNDELKVFLVPVHPTTGIEVTPYVYSYEAEQQIRTYEELTVPHTVIYDSYLPVNESSFNFIAPSMLTLAQAIEIHFSTKRYKCITHSTLHLITKYMVRATYQTKDFEANEALLRAGLLLGTIPFDRTKISLFECFILPMMKTKPILYYFAIAGILPYLIPLYKQLDEAIKTQGSQAIGSIHPKDETIEDNLSAKLANLLQTIGFPQDIKAIGIEEKDLASLAFSAFALWTSRLDAEMELSEEVFYETYKVAYQGYIKK